ncbi:hypothetical protein D3C72_1853270 [compost metagenome]
MYTDQTADQRPCADPDVVNPGKHRHGHVGCIGGKDQHFRLQRQAKAHDRHTPERAQGSEQTELTRQRQQQQQTGCQHGDGCEQEAVREALTVTTEQHRTEYPGTAEQQQQHGGQLATDLRNIQGKRLDVAVRGELRSNHQRHQHIHRHQCRTLEQHRHAAQ